MTDELNGLKRHYRGGGIVAYLIIRIIRQENIFLLISMFSLYAFGCYIMKSR